METRLATIADAKTLAVLHAESFGAAKWSADQLADSLMLKTTQGLVASDSNAIQGFILYQLAGSEAEILTFCTPIALRRKGIGHLLLSTAIQAVYAKDVRRVFLEVAADNDAALTLYGKAGFKNIGKRTGYYPRTNNPPVDAVMLSLDL
jgi:[ribosomal protein S18]-alanine N-acetyltransferase